MDTPLFGDEDKKKKDLIFYGLILGTVIVVAGTSIVLLAAFFLWKQPYQWSSVGILVVILYQCIPIIIMGWFMKGDSYVDPKIKYIFFVCYIGLLLTCVFAFFYIFSRDYPSKMCGNMGLYKIGTHVARDGCFPSIPCFTENSCAGFGRDFQQKLSVTCGTWNSTDPQAVCNFLH